MKQLCAWIILLVIVCCTAETQAQSTPVDLHSSLRLDGSDLLSSPGTGSWDFKVVSSRVLELGVITSKSIEGRPGTWDWVRGNGRTILPRARDFEVEVDGRRNRVRAVGFKRRVVYAPLGEKNLQIGNWLYLEVADPVPVGRKVAVTNPRGNVWTGIGELQSTADLTRSSPAIHVNQLGYGPGLPKKALVGYYLGSLGELPLDAAGGFSLVDAKSGCNVFSGKLVRRREDGWHDMVSPYRRVFEADFTEYVTTGRYRIEVPGLGRSLPFWIHPGVSAALARTYALGIYHQRCGDEVGLPFTRFAHGECHRSPAWIPTDRGSTTHGKALDNLYPHVRTSAVDVSGGHHDAGDYSKYLTNSARMVHALVLAADAFPGVSELDNLGLPESGDGKSDLLQLARWEADFIARMQDDDGGFYFQVYPKDRTYEDDVPPDRGDRQVVFPKQTAATAAAVAALAQASSSPRFNKEHRSAAERYRAGAEKGWRFLKKAWKRHGRDKAYRKINHYGDAFQDRDEVIWAATELFLATGRDEYLRELEGFDPTSPKTWHWQWVRLHEGYGAAVRSCALAEASGRRTAARIGRKLTNLCRKELLGAAHELAQFHQSCAYRTSFPLENKRHRTVGWYFSAEHLFDLAAASVLDSRSEFEDAMVGNVDYHLGANPLNLSYLSGLGYRRPLDIVSSWARNDRRMLPPSGIPLGDVVVGYGWIHGYGHERGQWSFPRDNDRRDPYPIYDRYTDSWNTQAEAITAVQARCLAGASFLMARTPFKGQSYTPDWAHITGVPDRVTRGSKVTASLDVKGLDIDEAVVVWDVTGAGLGIGPSHTFTALREGMQDVEVEAQWPDGRRAFATQRFLVDHPPADGQK